MGSAIRTLSQVAFLMLSWVIGAALVHLLNLPLPGGIVALAAVLAMLFMRVLPLDSVRHGADWLLAKMLLFFVPALLAVINHPEFLGLPGLKILLVIVPGTLAVMAVTGLVVELATRRRTGPVRAAGDE